MKRFLVKTLLVVVFVLMMLVQPVTFPFDEQVRDYNTVEDSAPNSTDSAQRTGRPQVVSLNGDDTTALPDFLSNNEESSQSASFEHSKFVLAANYSKPNITAVYWQNVTPGSNDEWVSWMQPGGTVKIWFEVKGPIELIGPNVTVSFDAIVDAGTMYGTNLGCSNLNSFGDMGVNDTQWFSWIWVIPDELSMDYGYGLGYVNAFALRLFGPFGESYYEGLNSTYSFLYMYGEIRVASMQWYNITGPNAINIAEPGWFVSPWYTISVENAPVWNVNFITEWRADVVWWLDEHIGWSALQHVSEKLYPGYRSVYPRHDVDPDAWVFYEIDPDATYGTNMAQRRGIYCKLFLNGTEIYSSNNEGNLLFVFDSITNRAPEIEVIAPMNGEVFAGSSVTVDAFISDPNGNHQIDTLLVYVDGTVTDVITDYIVGSGRLNTSVDLPQNNGVVNITLYAEDLIGMSANTTVLIRSDDPTAYFPSEYVSGHEHHALTFLEQRFTWESTLTYKSGEDVNVTFMPRVILSVIPAVEFDLYYGMPVSVSAGESYATYLKIPDPRISLTINMRLECGYHFSVQNVVKSGSVVLYDETWQASRNLELGIEVLDLRYDLPGVSEHIRPFTHYEIEMLKAFPVLSYFGELNLIIDIVPLLRLSNLLDASISGISCNPELAEITFAGDSLYVIQSSVSSALSGETCGVQLSDFNLSCAAGLDLSVELKLVGVLLGVTIKEVNLNEWMYENLDITIPSLDIWLGRVTLLLTGTVLMETDIEPQQLDAEIVSLSADENWINVTLSLSDESGNDIIEVSVTALAGGESCIVSEIGAGEYLVRVPYTPYEFNLSVSYSKTGYYGDSEDFGLYIDPYIVDSTPPSIANIEQNLDEPTYADEVVVNASIVDTMTGVVGVTLYYSIDGGASWSSVNMSLSSGTVYTGIIPAQEGDTTVLFYIVVSDGAGNDAQTEQFSYVVADSQTPTTTTPTTTPDTTSTTSGTETPTEPTHPAELDSAVILGVGAAATLGIVVVIIVALRRKKP